MYVDGVHDLTLFALLSINLNDFRLLCINMIYAVRILDG